jgi:hypothetical protein
VLSVGSSAAAAAGLTPVGLGSLANRCTPVRAHGLGDERERRLHTPNTSFEAIRLTKQKRCGLAVERIRRIWIRQQLRQKHLKHVDQI